MLIKGKNHREDVALLHMYAPNIRAPKLIKETELKLKSRIHSHALIVGCLNTPLTNRKAIQRKIKQKMLDLNYIICQTYITDIYTAFHPNTREYTFFSAVMKLSSKLTTYFDTN